MKNYNYKCIVAKNGSKMYYKRVSGKWKRVSNAIGMKAEKGKRKYRVEGKGKAKAEYIPMEAEDVHAESMNEALRRSLEDLRAKEMGVKFRRDAGEGSAMGGRMQSFSASSEDEMVVPGSITEGRRDTEAAKQKAEARARGVIKWGETSDDLTSDFGGFSLGAPPARERRRVFDPERVFGTLPGGGSASEAKESAREAKAEYEARSTARFRSATHGPGAGAARAAIRRDREEDAVRKEKVKARIASFSAAKEAAEKGVRILERRRLMQEAAQERGGIFTPAQEEARNIIHRGEEERGPYRNPKNPTSKKRKFEFNKSQKRKSKTKQKSKAKRKTKSRK